MEGAVQSKIVDVVEESNGTVGGVRLFVEMDTETLDDMRRGGGTR